VMFIINAERVASTRQKTAVIFFYKQVAPTAHISMVYIHDNSHKKEQSNSGYFFQNLFRYITAFFINILYYLIAALRQFDFS